MSSADEFGGSALRFGQILQPLPHRAELLGLHHQEVFELFLSALRHFASEVVCEPLQQTWGKNQRGTHIARLALLSRDVERHAKGIYRLYLWVADLASLDVRDARLGKVGS